MNPTSTTRQAGIDVSKDRLDVCIMPEAEAFAVANDPEGIDSLLGRLQAARAELVVCGGHRPSTTTRLVL